jgi:hypothetical protein
VINLVHLVIPGVMEFSGIGEYWTHRIAVSPTLIKESIHFLSL